MSAGQAQGGHRFQRLWQRLKPVPFGRGLGAGNGGGTGERSTVDEVGTRRVGRFVTGEEHDEAGDLFRFSHASQGPGLCGLLLSCVDQWSVTRKT